MRSTKRNLGAIALVVISLCLFVACATRKPKPDTFSSGPDQTGTGVVVSVNGVVQAAALGGQQGQLYGVCDGGITCVVDASSGSANFPDGGLLGQPLTSQGDGGVAWGGNILYNGIAGVCDGCAPAGTENYVTISGDTVLTPSQYSVLGLTFFGTLSGNAKITLPAPVGVAPDGGFFMWPVTNATAGGWSLTIYGAGTDAGFYPAWTIPPGYMAECYNDGTLTECTSASGTGLGGDLVGPIPDAAVIAIQGRPVTVAANGMDAGGSDLGIAVTELSIANRTSYPLANGIAHAVLTDGTTWTTLMQWSPGKNGRDTQELTVECDDYTPDAGAVASGDFSVGHVSWTVQTNGSGVVQVLSQNATAGPNFGTSTTTLTPGNDWSTINSVVVTDAGSVTYTDASVGCNTWAICPQSNIPCTCNAASPGIRVNVTSTPLVQLQMTGIVMRTLHCSANYTHGWHDGGT
jgi:hypothetical protein